MTSWARPSDFRISQMREAHYRRACQLSLRASHEKRTGYEIGGSYFVPIRSNAPICLKSRSSSAFLNHLPE